MNDILNYIKINELISTAGQPTKEQFQAIKDEGFEIVINLALSTATNALENEDKIVTQLGMTYIHIPVDFENPQISEVKQFLNIMQALAANKVFVHCALNYRVSAFMYVYHKYILQTPFEEVDLSLIEEFMPDEKWQRVMKVSFEELKEA